ncbi:MAG TPA: DinB family protein [Terriglobales bacterium]|nr:DinB family protein [Terriglobales bacterium]
MKTTTAAAIVGAMLVLCSFGLAQTQAPTSTKDEKKTVSQVLDSGIKIVEGDFVPAAEAMPEEKYGFAPTNGEFKGVRTFAEQIKHVAAINYIVAASILGEKPPVDTNGEKGPESAKSKADILKFLKDSFAYAHKSVATVTDANALEPIPSPFGQAKTTRLSLGSVFPWHSFDHYGQIVEYLRMNGIVPPASRN